MGAVKQQDSMAVLHLRDDDIGALARIGNELQQKCKNHGEDCEICATQQALLQRTITTLQSQQVASAEPSQIGYDDGSGRIRDWSGAAPRSGVSDALHALQEGWLASVQGKPGARRIATKQDDDFDNEVSAIRRCAWDLGRIITKIERDESAGAQPQPGRVEGWNARWHEGIAGLLLVSHPEHGGVGVSEEPSEARKIPETMLYLLARDLLAAPTAGGQEADHG